MSEDQATNKVLEELGFDTYTPLDINLALEDMSEKDRQAVERRVNELIGK